MSNQPLRTSHSPIGSLAAVLTALAALIAAALVASELAAGMFRSWNDVRLAPSAGLLQGLPLYSGPAGSGPIWSWIYGPVAPLLYLPSVLLPTPALALGVALAMSGVMFLGAAHVVLHGSSTARGVPALAAFVAFVLYTLAEPALRGAGYGVHADAPAIALAALACAAVATPARRTRSTALCLSAATSVLAVATKQVLLPLPLALAGFLAWSSGAGALRTWARWLALWLLLVGATSLTAFGAEPLVFNLVTIPAAHPWQWGGGASALGTAAGEFALRVWPLLLLLAFDGLATPGTTRWRDQPRSLLIVVGAALSAGGVLTRVKVGADVNAHAFGLFFFAIAAAGALADACAAASGPRRTAARGVLALGIAGASLAGLPALAKLPGVIRSLPENPEVTGVALARAFPGELYLPTHPLVMLYAEQRANHASYGVFDRELAGYPVRGEHFAAFSAPQFTRVGLWGTDDDPILRRLPGFTRRSRAGPHGQWVVLEPSGPGQSAPLDPSPPPAP